MTTGLHPHHENDDAASCYNDSGLRWFNFTTNFHNSVPEYATVKNSVERFGDKLIDLSPFMERRPFTCFENDPFQKVLSTFRLHNRRHLPILEEGSGRLAGIITRQDLFKYMKV